MIPCENLGIRFPLLIPWLCDEVQVLGLFVIQDCCKSNQQISLKYGVMIGCTKWKN